MYLSYFHQIANKKNQKKSIDCCSPLGFSGVLNALMAFCHSSSDYPDKEKVVKSIYVTKLRHFKRVHDSASENYVDIAPNW